MLSIASLRLRDVCSLSRELTKKVLQRIGDDQMPWSYLSMISSVAAKKAYDYFGFRTVIRAGSLFWPWSNEDSDATTYFGYDIREKKYDDLLLGAEHFYCWNVVTDSRFTLGRRKVGNYIVTDFSAFALRGYANSIGFPDFNGGYPLPSQYHVCRVKEMVIGKEQPSIPIYIPSADAYRAFKIIYRNDLESPYMLDEIPIVQKYRNQYGASLS